MSPLPHECFAAHDTAIPKLQKADGGKLMSLVLDIFQMAQRLQLRARPADWPSLIV